MLEGLFGPSRQTPSLTPEIPETKKNVSRLIYIQTDDQLSRKIKENSRLLVALIPKDYMFKEQQIQSLETAIEHANSELLKRMGVWSRRHPVCTEIVGVIVLVEKGAFKQFNVTDTSHFISFSNQIQHKIYSNLEFDSLDTFIYQFALQTSHQHRSIDITILSNYQHPINFKISSNIDMITKKLIEFIPTNEKHVSIIEHKLRHQSDNHEWISSAETLFTALHVDQLFPLLDLLRLIVIDTNCRNYFLTQKSKIIQSK